MKKIKTVVALLIAMAMLFCLTACGDKGADVTGKYICIGESYYGGDYSEPSDENWIELKKGGKGTYHSMFDFDIKWQLDGETFTATVKFLGLEEPMEGTIKDGVMEVVYGDYNMLLVKEGMEAPANPGAPAEPSGDTDVDGGEATASGEKRGVNDGVKVASGVMDAFANTASPFGGATTGGDSSGAAVGGDTTGTGAQSGGALSVLQPKKIENPSEWYGYVHATNCWGFDEDEMIWDARAYVDTEGKPYFEVYRLSNSGEYTLFLSMYMTLKDNDTTIVPDIGSDDAWLMDVYLTPADKDDFTVMLFDDGTIAAGFEYASPSGGFGFYVTMRFRLDGSLWDESANILPPSYAEYKAELLNNAGTGGNSSSATTVDLPPSAGGEYGKTTPDADGVVADFATLKAAFDWTRTQTTYENGYGKHMTYEMIAERMGVHGAKASPDSWKDDYHVYRWVTANNDSILISFKVDADGNETWNSSSWSSSLND